MGKNLLEFWQESPDDPFDVLFQHAPVMMGSIGHDGVLVQVSEFWASAMGYAPSEMVGRSAMEFLTPASRDYAVSEVLPVLFKKGRTENIAYDFVRRSGEILPVRMSSVAQYGPGGEFVRSLSLMFDDSEARKNATILDAAMEAIPEGFVIYGSDDKLVRCNDAYKAMYSASAPAIREGATFESIIRYGLENGQYPQAGETRESQEAWLANRIANHHQPKGAIEQQVGPERWLSIKETRTSCGHTVGIRNDISELKKAQSDAERFGRILEYSTHEILVVDAGSLKFEIANEAARRNLGYSKDQLMGMTLAEIDKDLGDPERIRGMVDELIESPVRHLSLRTTHRRNDGTIYPCDVRLEVDQNGDRPLIVALCEDITERQALEQEINERNAELAHKNVELTEAAAEAARASRAKSVFLANMSHEIRTPLNGVLGMTTALSNTALTQDQAEMTEIVLASGKQLLGLLNDILDLSKIEAGDISMEREATDAQSLMAEIVDLFDANAEAKGLSLNVQTSRATRRPILANTARIRQVISNLTSNAVKFTAEGGVTLSAELKDHASDANSAMLTIFVTDTGAGVPDDMKEVIFGRFEQGTHTVEQELGGTGLGLPIASTICALHGGSLSLEDAPGGGARFIATFEVGRTDAKIVSEPKIDPMSRLSELRRPLHLLIAEDNPLNQRVMSALLTPAKGVTATYVKNGAEALKMIENERFDAALVDIRMPVMGGLEMVRIHRENERKSGTTPMPIVACSANIMTDQVAHYEASGFGWSLGKPFGLDTLLPCLERIIDEIEQAEGSQVAKTG